MSDSIPENEQSIYDQLTDIRQHLSNLKKDRKNFIKSKDVSDIYNKVLKILNHLESKRQGIETAPNRVDYLIDDIFQLLSLCYMTVGLTQTAPLTYASLSTVQRLLEHLEESGVYTSLELNPIKERLDKFASIIRNGEEEDKLEEEEEDEAIDDELIKAKKDEYKLLNNKLNKCYTQYQTLVDNISTIPADLQEILGKLVSYRRNLLNLITREDTSHEEELKQLRLDLKQLEASEEFTKVTKNLKDEEGGTLLNGLIDDCHTLISDLAVSKNESQVDPSLKDLYNELIKVKITLESLMVTRRWTLRETDLYSYQKFLQEIDNKRKSGKFLNSSNEAPVKGQAILLYILRRCYAIIYKLLESSEPISEALQPIHNQLSTVRRCLLDVKRMGGISSIRELYPYQLKLASIDNLRQDGKFMCDDQIPEGQGALNLLLLECFDIVHELKINYYDNYDTDENDLDSARRDIIETTKSSVDRSDSYDDNNDGDESDDERGGGDDEEEDDDEEASDLDGSLLIGADGDDDDEDDADAYDLPSYAASVNESEIPTDIEK